MTRFGDHHLPEPDNDAFEKTLKSLSRRGLKLTTTRRIVLATAHRFGWFDGPDGIAAILRDALESVPPVPPEIVARREVEAMRRHHSHRAAPPAPAPHPQPPKWQVSEDGTTFYHPACDKTLPGGIDCADTDAKAADHHNRVCPEVARYA